MHERPALSIRHRLVLILVATVLGVIALHDGAAYLNVRRAALAGAHDRLGSVAAQLGGMLESSVSQMRAQTQAAARDTAVRALLTGAATQRITDSAVARLRRLAGTGVSVAVVELRDIAGRRLWTTAAGPVAADDTVGRDVHRGIAGPDSSVVGRFVTNGDTLAYPVVAKAARGSEVLGYVVQWRRVGGSREAQQQLLALIGAEATLYLGNTRGSGWTDFARAAEPPPVPLPAAAAVEYARAGSDARLAATRAVAGAPWTLVVETSRAAVLAPARAMIRELAWLTALLLALGGAAAWLLATRLTTPLAELGDAAAAMSAGDYSRRVAVGRHDEVGALAATFNTMAESVAGARDRLAAYTKEIEDQAAELSEQTAELELANQDLSESVEEAVHARDALDAALGAHALVAAELDAALASAPVGFAFYDTELRFRRVNASLAAFTGFPADAHIGRTVAEVVPTVAPAIEGHLRNVLQTGECVFDVEFSGEMAGEPGVVRHWLTTYYPIRAADGAALGVGAVVSDRTGYKALEQQYRHAQKMEAVGRLAGGVAHDFNNVLTAIGNYSQFLLDDLGPGDPRADDVAEISRATERAARLVRQLLAFSRQQVLQPRALDLNATVGDLAPMLGRLIGAQVHLDTKLEPALGVVHADPGQVEQILVNLVVNAQDAMPAGGTLTIETANAELDAEYAEHHLHAVAGSYVVLAVSDTGCGMSRETQARIFEPFFTTKETGKGTGLGLATVYGIVKQSAGYVWVYSELGRGTTFKIYLPLAAGDVDDGDEVLLSRPAPAGGAETILLVEDDDAVRAAARRTLARAGYTVLEASNGTEALARYAEAASPIDLVVTDLVMPEMGGRDLAARLRACHPHTRVLYMSGFTQDAAVRQSVLAPGEVFLEKPFTPDGLARKIREVLALPANEARAA